MDRSIHKAIPSTGLSGGMGAAVGVGQIFTASFCSAVGWSGWKGVSVGGKIKELPASGLDTTGVDPAHEFVLKEI